MFPRDTRAYRARRKTRGLISSDIYTMVSRAGDTYFYRTDEIAVE